MSERLATVKLRDLPLEERLAAVERILAEDPHMPARERKLLQAIARDPKDRGGRIVNQEAVV